MPAIMWKCKSSWRQKVFDIFLYFDDKFELDKAEFSGMCIDLLESILFPHSCGWDNIS